jgi:hypothetical protein
MKFPEARRFRGLAKPSRWSAFPGYAPGYLFRSLRVLASSGACTSGSPACGFVTLRDVLADSSPDVGMMGVLGIPVGLRAAFFCPVTVE